MFPESLQGTLTYIVMDDRGYSEGTHQSELKCASATVWVLKCEAAGANRQPTAKVANFDSELQAPQALI